VFSTHATLKPIKPQAPSPKPLTLSHLLVLDEDLVELAARSVGAIDQPMHHRSRSEGETEDPEIGSGLRGFAV
jgi:hypothetical protein